jgi:magnesium-transporting ATPase (P-type)
MSENREIAECRREADRREVSWRSFVYGNFRPRRRHSRREEDGHRILFDWYEPRVLYLALGLLLLSCADALFTLNLLNHGAAEANFFMARALEHGMDTFLAGKISLTGISLICLVAVVRRKFIGDYSVEHLLQFFFVAYVLVICYEIYIFEFVFELNIFSLNPPE